MPIRWMGKEVSAVAWFRRGFLVWDLEPSHTPMSTNRNLATATSKRPSGPPTPVELLNQLAAFGAHAPVVDVDAMLAIDLSYRPLTYFGTSEELLANIFGDERKEAIRRELQSGRGANVPAALYSSELSAPGVRHYLGAMDPTWMGGEYLPSLFPGEVEIARVRLDSTTGDVSSIRARSRAVGIRYRVVDEYMEGYSIESSPKTSKQPITLAKLIRLIHSAGEGTWSGQPGTGLVEPCWPDIWNEYQDYDEVRSFTRVGSEFYPGIGEYFDLLCAVRCAEWSTKGEAIRR